jgi:hypothetical protein
MTEEIMREALKSRIRGRYHCSFSVYKGFRIEGFEFAVYLQVQPRIRTTALKATTTLSNSVLIQSLPKHQHALATLSSFQQQLSRPSRPPSSSKPVVPLSKPVTPLTNAASPPEPIAAGHLSIWVLHPPPPAPLNQEIDLETNKTDQRLDGRRSELRVLPPGRRDACWVSQQLRR